MRTVNVIKGDYVLATKYSDGDPHDQWCIGFYDKGENGRHYVIDSEGNQFRHNGFRRVAKISNNRGKWLLENKDSIEFSGKSLWHFSRVKIDTN
jgi:hypothetical protein